MKVNGQLEVAQAEQLTSDPALLPTGRLWANIANTSAALLKFFDGTTTQTLQFQSKTAFQTQNSGLACTVDWSKGLNQQVVLTNHAVISFTNPQAGQLHVLQVTQATYNTSGNLYQYKLNMIDQENCRLPYQPLGALQPSDNDVFRWYYSAGVRAAYASVPAVIASPTALPGSAATGITISPDGKVIQHGNSTSPYVHNYPFFDAGARATWGIKDLVTNTTAVAAMVAVEYSPDYNFLFGASGTTPYIQGWHVGTGGGTSTVLSNPATLPAGAASCCAVHPSGNYVGVGHATTPFMSLYPYTGNGYGTKLTDPVSVPAAAVTSLAFAPTGDYLAVGSGTTPFIQAYPFNPIAGTIGTLIANPGTLPGHGPAGSLGRGIAWRPQGDFIAFAAGADNKVFVFGFNRATGTFTATILSASTTASAACVAWTPDGQFLLVGVTGSPYLIVYDFSASVLTTTLTFDSGPTAVNVNDICIHPNGEIAFLAAAGSPYVIAFPLPNKVRNYLRT